MNVPQLPAQTGPFLWGAASGAVARAIVKSWEQGGYVFTGGEPNRDVATACAEVLTK